MSAPESSPVPAPGGAAAARAARSPLSYPIFRALWVAGVVSFVGTFVQIVSEAWLMLSMTESPLPVAMLATTFVGTSLIAMLPAGVLADRYDRRKVVLASQVVQAGSAVVMAGLAYTHHITPASLLACVAVAGLGMALGSPAWAAMIPELVPRALVAEAVALNAVAFNLARAVGPAIGGVVLARFGAPAAFLLNAASFVGVMIAMLAYPAPVVEDAAPASRRPLASAFAEPWSVMVTKGDVRSVTTAMFGFTLGAGIFYGLTPSFGRDVLGASAFEYGVLIGMMGAGAVAGATLLKYLRPRTTPRALVAGTMLLFAACSFAVARATSIRWGMAIMLPAGLGWVGSFSSLAALVQLWAPDRLRARIIALYQMLHLATWALGSAVGGAVAERWGIRGAMELGAVVCALAAVSTWRVGLPASFAGHAS